MKPKKWLLIGIAVLGLAMMTHAQEINVTNPVPGAAVATINPPSSGLFDKLPAGVQTGLNYLAANTNALTATNWTAFAAYSRISGGKSQNGATFGLVYYLNPYVGAQVRMQYANTGQGKWFLPNGSITMQSAYKPIDSLPITLRPLVEAGTAVDFNGRLYAIVGAGSELDLWTSPHSYTAIQRISLFYGTEAWEGQGLTLHIQQFGGAVNMNLGAVIGDVKTWVTSALSKL